jgi:hypothetical protein
MVRIGLDERYVGQRARTVEADRLEELAFETEVQASLTRPEHLVVPPPVEAQLRSLFGPRADGRGMGGGLSG